MADYSRSMETLRRDLADLKRQVASIADSVSEFGRDGMPRHALRDVGRQAERAGEVVQYTVRRHPLASGAVGLAVLGAALCLAVYAARENRSSQWRR